MCRWKLKIKKKNYACLENILSEYQCSFYHGYITQHWLFAMTEKLM